MLNLFRGDLPQQLPYPSLFRQVAADFCVQSEGGRIFIFVRLFHLTNMGSVARFYLLLAILLSMRYDRFPV